MIKAILDELNLENGTNYKLEVLKKYKDDELLQRVLKMAMCKVCFTYGVTMKNVKAGSSENNINLSKALDELDRLARREVTGNAAIGLVENTLERVSEADREVITLILGRDLKINMGRTNINKVMKGLIVKPVYCRCSIYTTDKKIDGKLKKGTERKISYPAIVQLKADGTYREISKIDGNITSISRSGETYSYPKLENLISNIKEDGYFTGELTVRADKNLINRILPKIIKEDSKNGTNYADKIQNDFMNAQNIGKEFILPRSISNGLLNSDNVPQENIVYEVWDFITPEDYALAGLKDRKNLPKIPYIERFNKLKNIVEKINNSQIRVIEYKVVNNLKEATNFTSEKMNQGLEGAILKDYSGLFKDGTHDKMLKMKIAFQLDVRITGFVEGKKGTKREKTFGSMEYSTDDGLIKGSVSGFTDKQLEDFNSKREELIGKIIEIEGNDLTQGRGNNYYAVSHPRFIELRSDKDYTDTLERSKEMLESAKEFK